MAKQLNVNLNFNANTQQAVSAIMKLQTELNSLTTSTTTLPVTEQLVQAQQSAAQLKVALSQAFNVDTGKFDMLKFNQSIKKSGTSLEEIRNRLMSIGPAGQQAFLSLAQSIASAEIPTRRISALFTELGVTLKNTLKWQLSSSVLHGFMGAIQGAYGYAQDLNKSLNEIRIVSGASVEEMDKFAEKANKAAKSLSSSTLDYTNAALIYYQQGLDEKSIEERTAITLKMANVSGQSAQEVSDQMTAVWNNFYNGSQSLEYYSDVMTALGAATASSTEEIATGLEKFSAVADTVGLSYEYATSALATVTATTRQSAEVVGTAFKTLFARIQDLELGETLDDGTTLGSYSQALAKVGINIKDTSGELKSMDTILEEMASKWETLGTAEKTALAQSVAGVRQYTQLIALMDNWDFMQENLSTVASSEGALSAQAEVYAESWEGARDRVKAAAEAIYKDLLKDEFFIDLTNGMEKILTLFDNFIDSIGGVKGLLFGLSSILLHTFSGAAAQGLENMVYNLKSFLGLAAKEAMATQNKVLNLATTPSSPDNTMTLDTAAGQGSIMASQEQVVLSQELAKLKEKMTEEQRFEAQYILEQNRAYGEQLVLLGQKVDQANTEKDEAGEALFNEAGWELGAERAREAMANIDADVDFGDSIVAEVQQAEAAFKETGNMDAYKAKLAEIKQMVKEQGGFEQVEHMLDGRSAPHNGNLTEDVELAMKKDVRKNATNYLKENKSSNGPAADPKVIEKYIDKTEQATKVTKKFEKGQKNLNTHTKQASKQLKGLTKTTKSLSTTIVQGAQAAMSLSYAISSLSNIGDILSNKELSAGEKMLQIMMALGTAIPMLVNGLKGLNSVMGITTLLQQKETTSAALYLALQKSKLSSLTAEKVAKASHLSLDQAELALTQAKIVARTEELAASGANIAAMTAEQLVEKTGMTLDQAKIVISKLSSGATLAEALAEAKLTVAKGGGLGAILKTIAAKGGETGSRWANVVAMIAEKLGMSELLVLTIALTAAVLVLVAVVAGIIALFKAWKESTPEARLAAAKEESARLSEELNKAKEAAENLKKTIESYDSAVDKIKTLTKGTEEWKQAISEANQSAREIIDLGGMEGKYHFNTETGLIEFEDGALEESQKIADDRVTTLNNQKLHSDNVVLATENVLKLKEASEISSETELKQIVGLLSVMAAQPTGYGLLLAGNAEQGMELGSVLALNELTEAYEKSNGSFNKAVSSLNGSSLSLIAAMGKSDSELQELCEATRANTEAIQQNNKEIIDTTFEDNMAYKYSANQGFLGEVLAEDLNERTETLYDTVYKDKPFGMTDKEAQEQYASLVGWDPYGTINESNNRGTYTDNEGNTHDISDKSARRYLALDKALEQLELTIGDYNKNISKLETKEAELAAQYEAGTLTYQQYLDALTETGKALGFTEAQMDKYASNYASDTMVRAGKEATLSYNISSLGIEQGAARELVQKLTKEMSDENLDIALDVSATAESLDDFYRKFREAATQALIDSIEASADQAKTLLVQGEEQGTFKAGDLRSMMEDENFAQWMQDEQIQVTDIITGSYSQQYQALSKFYMDSKSLTREQLREQKEYYEEDLAAYQAILDYKWAKMQNNQEAMTSLKESWGTTINFEAYMHLDTGEIQDKIVEIEDQLEEISNKEYDINMSWEDIELMEQSFNEIGDFTKMMRDEAKKVGKSYQLTAAQAKKWMALYPELFSTAKKTSDGLISLSEEQYDAFVETEKGKRDSTIETYIAEAKARLAQIPAEKEALQIRLAIFESLAKGKINLEKASAEDLVAVRSALTQFYIDSGLDEVNANTKALSDMGLSQEQYSKLVADFSEDNATNMTDSAKESATNVMKVFKQLGQNLKNVFINIGKAIWSVMTFDFNSAQTLFSQAISDTKNAFSTAANDFKAIRDSSIGDYAIDGDYTIYKNQAEYNEAKTSALQEAINDIRADMAMLDVEAENLTSQITYLQALKQEDLADYGSTDPDGSDKDKENKDLMEIAERYHEITQEVEALQHSLELLQKAKDRAFGREKLKLMDEEIAALEELSKKQEELYLAQKVFLALDKQAVSKTFSEAEFNEDGVITNYSSLVGQAANELNQARTRYNNSGQSDSDKKTLEQAEKKYEDKIKVLETYEETLTATRESEIALQDSFDNWQNAHMEQLNYELELKVSINEADLKRIEYLLEKLDDDFYQRAEGLALMTQELNIYKQGLTDYKDQIEALDQALAAGEISKEAYWESMDEIIESIYDNLDSLNELDTAMMEYYGETLQMASEEIDKVTDQMEHHNSVLEHYLSILELMGEQANYKTIGVVLEGQAEVKKDRMIAAQKEWQMFQEETDAKYLAWKNATDEASAEMLKKQYEDALVISTEAQEEYLSLAEEYAESLRAILENSLLEYAQDLENALTGGTSFDQMNTKLERAAAIQEEYLTTTNKIYETNKLMNTAQQEIDKTTNTIAKQRLKQFIDETNQLQKKNKLSKYELDIQQAKYDLLLAEIALEEAQNAKSSVRLQRDSEGNFGYVYTADQDKIADAQQKLADAQNSLYNIALEGSNDYFTKYQETLNEMYDTFTELHQQYLDGEFESEQEYQNAVAEAKAYYYELLEQYSDLYTIAISTDARALEDAWSSEFNSMVYNTKNWQTQVDIYLKRSQQSFSNYAKQIDTLAGELGVSGSYNEVANSVGNIVDQNEALLATLLSPGGVFDTMEMEIALVNDVCAAYAVERATVLELIKTYEALALSIMNVKRVEAGKEPLGSLDLPTNNAEQDTAVPGSAKAGDGVPKVGDRVKYNSGKYYHSSDGLSPTGTRYQGSEVYITDINTASWAKYPYHISTGNKLYSGDLGWLKLNQISGYDTGGYTGRWGSYGKLAMLHEKEIVLNKQDTENFLQSMELLDNIVKTIDLYSANQQISGLLNSPSFGKLDSGTLEQMVTIDAHFPNVSSRVEIEEAFSTLINRASQYVNRN